MDDGQALMTGQVGGFVTPPPIFKRQGGRGWVSVYSMNPLRILKQLDCMPGTARIGRFKNKLAWMANKKQIFREPRLFPAPIRQESLPIPTFSTKTDFVQKQREEDAAYHPGIGLRQGTRLGFSIWKSYTICVYDSTNCLYQSSLKP